MAPKGCPFGLVGDLVIWSLRWGLLFLSCCGKVLEGTTQSTLTNQSFQPAGGGNVWLQPGSLALSFHYMLSGRLHTIQGARGASKFRC